MTWIHKSAEDLKAAGYVFAFTANCRSKKCGRMLFFYRTPSGGTMPVDPITFTPHWQTCPEPKRFRKQPSSDQKEIKASKPDKSRPTDPLREMLSKPMPQVPQMELFD